MWSSGRRVLQDLFSQAAVRSLSLTPAQNTVVVERWWTVPLSKIGSPPRLNPRRHRIYKLVEDTKHAPREKMELILTETVPKLGGRGDTVFVKKRFGRNKLLPKGLAVYPSPENKQMFAEELRLLREGKLDRKIQTGTALHTADFLKNSILKINKMPCEEFQLTKEVVSRQFLKKLRVVVPLHALTLPFEPIKELGDYWCEIVINRTTTVRVPMSLVPYEDPSASYQRQLKIQRQQEADADNLEAVDQDENKDEAVVRAVSEAIASQVSEASETAASEAQISQDTTAPPSDGPKKE